VKLITYPDFIALIDAEGKNVATFYGPLRYVDAELAFRPHLAEAVTDNTQKPLVA
jgi:hypothetical protein